MRNIIYVIAIFRLAVKNIETRNNFLKLSELLKKRFIKVEISTVLQRIPIITPPFLMLVNGETMGWIVHRDNRIAAQS